MRSGQRELRRRKFSIANAKRKLGLVFFFFLFSFHYGQNETPGLGGVFFFFNLEIGQAQKILS